MLLLTGVVGLKTCTRTHAQFRNHHCTNQQSCGAEFPKSAGNLQHPVHPISIHQNTTSLTPHENKIIMVCQKSHVEEVKELHFSWHILCWVSDNLGWMVSFCSEQCSHCITSNKHPFLNRTSWKVVETHSWLSH